MSYKMKKTIVPMVSGALLMAAYCINTFGKVQSGAAAADDLKFWATQMLLFIGIGIVALIIIEIVFHIVLSISMAVKEQVQNGKCSDKEIEKTIERTINLEMVEDEMDKLIELKSLRVGYSVAGIGFVAALIYLALGYSPAVMLNILFFSFAAGSMAEGAAQLFFYHRGVKNG